MFSIFSSADPTQSLRRHFDCHFCGQKFLRRHQKLFLVHLEQKHLSDLEQHLQESDMMLEVQSLEHNVEIKLLQNLSSKCRLTRSSPNPQVRSKKRSISAQRVKNDLNDLNFYEKLNLTPEHVYAVIESPPNLSNTMKKLKKKLRKSESLKAPNSSQKSLKKSLSSGGGPKSRTYQSKKEIFEFSRQNSKT